MSTENIAQALSNFQAEMPIVAKAHTAKVTMKSGGNYSYTYADLADVTESAMPLLTKHGLAFSSLPQMGDRGYELRGVLLHTSGDTLEGVLPIAGNSPQELGSSLTYMRRYLLGCLTGIVTDDDDDGRHAQQAKATRTTWAGTTEGTEPLLPITPEHDSVGHLIDVEASPMKRATRGRLFALFGEHGIDEDQQLPGINHICGTELTSRSQLTEAMARQVIGVLEKRSKPVREEQPA